MRTLANTNCGTATAATCQGGAPAGACMTPITAGLPSTIAAGVPVLSNIGNPIYPSGRAGTIVACVLRVLHGHQCSTCVE
jgi:hypothetical protein